MATQLTGATGHRRSLAERVQRLQRAQRPAREERHPAVALAIALPCAIALMLLFGGWDQMVTQTKAVADLIGR
ncbi:hypothetical protein [Kitasatospora sp. GAS204B]|uniref:hypothetical protein n=1 Tax=unclassified Kitasatospora TaxID=2633591 RepID=UPI0024743B24|nr:hypothetical protein [Kitasatospora sp. GAS204B]MDH6122760.1 uncharacterized membrane protein YjjP (DUF1212 family) [Kitasatospora sp. GAS204B]